MTQEQVASALDWSLSKLIRMEGGTVGISTTDLRALLGHYGVTDPTLIANLVELSREARTGGWWTKYKDLNDPGFLDYIGYEAGAARIRQWQPLLIPGLLQTSEYSAEIAGAFLDKRPDHIRHVVELRQERQRRLLDSTRPPDQIYILDEAVLRRPVGAAMPQQLQHLIELSERPEITIEVVPFAAGAHSGLRGPFVLLSFTNGLDDLLYLESSRSGDQTLRDQNHIADYHEIFDELSKIALGPDDSAKFITDIIEGFRPP
jgi:hypothetical protein